MQPTLKNLVSRYWLLFFFIGLFLFMLIFKISFREIWATISSLRPWQLAALVSVYLMISTIRVLARKYLLFSLKHTCGLKNLALIHFSTMAAHYSTPAKIGFPLTVYLLNKMEDVPYGYGTAVVLIELVVSTGLCALIAFFGSLVYFHEYSSDIIKMILLLVLFLVFFFLCLNSGLFQKKFRNSRIAIYLENVFRAFSHIALTKLLIYLVIACIIRVISCTNLMLMSIFFSADLTIWQAVTAGSTAFFLGAISMIPMGLGVRELSMLLFLQHFGIDNGICLTIVTIQRLLSSGLSFVLGIFFGSILGVKNILIDGNNPKVQDQIQIKEEI